MIFDPYPYQQRGVDWITGHDACALFWGMGTGKTVTTLTALDRLLAIGEVTNILVIAPKRVAEVTWATEAEKWDSLRHLRVTPIIGSARAREAALTASADIHIISRDNVQWLCEACRCRKAWPWDTVVIDELSSFKNPSAKRFRALRKWRGHIKRVIGLTGTPAPNGLIDLWSQIWLLDQGDRLGRTVTGYRETYFKPDRMNGHIVYKYSPLPGAEQAIWDKLGDLCSSLRKEDVLSLPGQIMQDVKVQLPPKVLADYRRFERDMVMAAMNESDTISAANAAALTGKLLQFANGAIYTDSHGVQEIHTAKLDALEELIEQAGGDPVLVFYSFRHDADRIRQRVATRGLDTADDIAAWNRGEIPIALAHPASVGHGLNLQSGGHIIIWFGLPWSLELYQQANERLNRPGQKNVCMIYHIIAEGTHDELVLQALSRKDTTQQALIEALLDKHRKEGIL